MAELKKFTIKELEEYNGKDGKPTYVAFRDKVYDFSQSSRWYGGDHMNRHHAGKDLTKELKMSHHGKKVLERASVKLVGRLV